MKSYDLFIWYFRILFILILIVVAYQIGYKNARDIIIKEIDAEFVCLHQSTFYSRCTQSYDDVVPIDNITLFLGWDNRD